MGNVTEWVLNLLGVNVNGQAKQALASIIKPDFLTGVFPEELLRLDPVVTQAGLFSNSGALALSMELNVPFDTRTFAALLEVFLKLRT